MINIGINGFGRIGRLILRAILENYKGKIKVVGINDLGSIEANAHLIKFDSTHGTLSENVNTSDDGFKIGDENIKSNFVVVSLYCNPNWNLSVPNILFVCPLKSWLA